MHATASVNGQVIAETDNYEVVEGNIYFPPAFSQSLTHIPIALGRYNAQSLSTRLFHEPLFLVALGMNDTTDMGDASYYNITTGGKTELKDAAWYYPETLEKANHIKNYIAFYKTLVDVKSE
ncbi:hypothetical protein VE03_08353 [Pseudogymnoascus sp. 23342-1-I1]|nr:hypothetical protein VE03_08353 [Pseudogymnoascus sp. 23342-1-I1]